ncbi:hypothetical protein MLD38_033809 [Melastoma candidum]|uniref:Uncharacterized protein n=1 Tax=Melastoma candidum TaxID=119954 RepID=A0ACB9M8I3_9MYRT|nr:hypothetical protein MLD38_033809 [Melastoma candidum]
MDPPPSAPPSKLRLMCSYGGRVTTRPHYPKTLTYLGGETRIVTVHRSSTASSLSSLLSHISSALSIPSPFSLKYLLPNSDLDSLISLVSDDDLALMLDELDRMSSSSRPSRIRLFVFRDREEEGVVEVEERGKVGSIRHPKTETWFSDALKGTRMGCGVGDGGPESVVLDTSSSFGSTSSSVSYSSLPAVGCAAEETRGRFGMADSYSREYSLSSAVSSTQAGGGPYNERAVHSTHVETQGQVSYYGVEPGRTVQVPGYPLPQQFDQLRHVQYVSVGMPYGIDNPSTAVTRQPPNYPPYHMQPPPPEQPLHFYYPPNQPCPVYMVPAVQAPPQYGSSATVDYGQPLMHHSNPMIHPQVPPAQAPLVDSMQGLAKLQPMLIEPQPQLQPQPLISVGDNRNFGDHFEEDPSRFQIYKSQPLPPPIPTQYQTMAEATTLMLTEALTQTNTGGDKQQN